MVYILERRTNNGYRCSCCKRTDTDVEKYSTLEAVLREVPRTHDEAVHQDWEVEELTVIDGATGEKVVDLWLRCTVGVADKYSASKGAVWQGYILNESIESNSSNIPEGMKFEDFEKQLQAEHQERKLRQAEQDLERARARVEALRKA